MQARNTYAECTLGKVHFKGIQGMGGLARQTDAIFGAHHHAGVILFASLDQAIRAESASTCSTTAHPLEY